MLISKSSLESLPPDLVSLWKILSFECYEWSRFRLFRGELNFQPLLALTSDQSQTCWFFQHGVTYTHPFLSLLFQCFIIFLNSPSFNPSSLQLPECDLFDRLFYHLPNHWLNYKKIFFEHLLICQVLRWALGIQRLVRQNRCPRGAHLPSAWPCRLLIPIPYS